MEFPTNFIWASKVFADFDNIVPAPYLRKSFTITKPITDGELVITGLGFYRVFLNGIELTKCILAPYISNPDDIIFFDRYEITQHLQNGENVIGILLGNGMQNYFGGFPWAFDRARWRGAPMTALRITAHFSDNTELLIESDTSFRTHDSPLRFNDLRCGEWYDAREEIDGWNRPGFDDSDWKDALPAPAPQGEYRFCVASPIVLGAEKAPVSISPYQDGYLYDFGVNGTGICRIKITGAPGQKIRMFHGEWYHDGILEEKNLHCREDSRESNVQWNEYICRGTGEEIYSPWFSYYGFRYVYIQGITEQQATRDLLTHIFVHGNFKENGSFYCSDEVANKLQECTRRSTLSNFLWYPTDCPHREKNGWTGDAAVSAEHMLMNLRVDDSLRQWLRCVAAAQDDNGTLPSMVPTGGWGFSFGNGPAWDQVLIEIPYRLYHLRGDLDTAREHSNAIFRYLQWIDRIRDNHGLVAFGLGDWCTPGRRHDDYLVPLEVTDTAVCIDITHKAAILFERLNWKEAQYFALELHDTLVETFRQHLIDFSTMTVHGATQTGQAIALYYQIFKDDERTAAFIRLKELIRESNDHFTCGMIGLRVLFRVLTEFNETDLAFKMITRSDYPSYGNWIQRGATTLWEDFYPENGPVFSQNHHFFGDISAWFIQSIAGILPNPDVTDPNTINITPHFVSKLDFAQATYCAPGGTIWVRWERMDQKIRLKIQVPQSINGCICLPANWKFTNGNTECPLSAGEYICIS